MMMFFAIAPGAKGRGQKLHVGLNRRLPKDFPGNRGDGKRAQQGIEICRRTEEIGKKRKLPTWWMLSHSISSSISPSKGGVAWADDVYPVFFGPGPERLATAVHFNDQDAHDVSMDIGAQMSHCEHILERLKQAMNQHFAGRIHAERLPSHDPLELSMLDLVEIWRTVIASDIHWPAPGMSGMWKQRHRLVHYFTSLNITSIQCSKVARLRVPASVSSTPLK